MARSSLRPIDRAIAAAASRAAPSVAAQLIPLLTAELDKFKQMIREDVSAQIESDINQRIDNIFKTLIREQVHPLLEEISFHQIKNIKDELLKEIQTKVQNNKLETNMGFNVFPTHSDIKWFHSINLVDDVITNGVKSADLLEAEFSRLGLSSEALTGKRVLDIGCNDGFFSLRCAELGADVTAIDGIYTDGLKFIRNYKSPKFKFYCMDMLSPSFRELGHFDIILYLGVLYHTMFPFEQLSMISNACANDAKVFIETEYYNIQGFEDVSTIVFDYDQNLSIDASSPVYPSIAWIVRTLSRLGFTAVTMLDPPSPPTAPRGRILVRVDYPRRPSDRKPIIYAAEQI